MNEDKVTLPSIAPSEYTNTSRVIHKGPCIVKSVLVAGDGVAGDCQVYDGLNDKGKLKAFIATYADMSFTWRPGDGTDFDYGLYIAVSAATTHVTVTFIPESRKAFI